MERNIIIVQSCIKDGGGLGAIPGTSIDQIWTACIWEVLIHLSQMGLIIEWKAWKGFRYSLKRRDETEKVALASDLFGYKNQLYFNTSLQ